MECSSEDFVKRLSHQTGQRFSVETISDLETFITAFGGMVPPEEDETASTKTEDDKNEDDEDTEEEY